MSEYQQFFRQGPAFTAAARTQEAGLKPLKATGQILYNAKEAVRGSVLKNDVRSVEPKSLFMPVNAAERREMLLGEYPIAVEPTAAEISAFG
ncbi:hypothetical protein [Sphingomonas faeni]|uniref:hypothetical protein n=1 Tax=Sphingomonas faeni TaxID=185950 RepID=UPI002786BF0F|nr:hypothetical protein [Sphingomonas faeni]MDQ0836977.1 hypothetical protein [Sphingomonas faeni]